MTEIIFTESDFYNILEEFIGNKNSLINRGLGKIQTAHLLMLLVRPPQSILGINQNSLLQITNASTVPDKSKLYNPLSNERILAHLVFGIGDLSGKVWGISKKINASSDSEGRAEFEAISKIKVIGGRMPEFKVENFANNKRINNRITDRDLLERHSRTIGALSFEIWQKLISLTYSIVGCGRTGSVIATTLARMGIDKITLIDPDKVELHNLGEMEGLTNYDIGKSKDQSLAYFIQKNCFSGKKKTISAIDKPIGKTDLELASSDVIFSCVDNDAARLSCGLAATSNHKILIDVGTGILSERVNVLPSRGIDIRLIVPADGCIRCFGNLVNYDEALSALVYNQDFSPAQQNQQWWQQRNGSLQYLNQIASGYAIKLLCDFLSVKKIRSTWLQMEFDKTGEYRLERIVRNDDGITPNCPLCKRSGSGVLD